MSDQADRLRLTLQEDGGGAETAFKELLKSELSAVFRHFMDVDDISVSLGSNGIDVHVKGGNLKRVGFCPKW